MASNKCAACKVLGGACTKETCIFAPFFPSTNPQRFENVHKIFGADNVYKFLKGFDDLSQRGNAAAALCYEAEARINDPISGVVGMVIDQERHLESVKNKIELAKRELETIMKPDEIPPFVKPPMPDDFLASPSSLEIANRDEVMSGASSSVGSSAGAGSSNVTQNIPPQHN